MKTSRVFAVLVLFSLAVALVFSCSGPEEEEAVDYECDGDVQTNTVSASEWVREHTEIERYRYESDPDADVVVLHLLDDSDDSLGVLTIEGFFGLSEADPEELHAPESIGHQVKARMVREGELDLELVSDAVISNPAANEFRTRTHLTRGDAEVMIRNDFKGLGCYANEEPSEAAGHPCAWPVPVFEPEYSVPTCGFDVNPAFPQAPNLTAIEYRVPTEVDPGVGGYLYMEDAPYATFDAVESGARIGDAAEIAEWLEQSGAGEIIGSEAEQLLSAAYSDPTWMDHVEEHARACLAEELETSDSELVTVRQGQQWTGFACGPDNTWQMAAITEGDIDVVRQAGSRKCNDCADACGKPHLRTYDGSSFPFHAAGEFILSTSTVGAPFDVQIRTEPAGSLSCLDDVEACQQVTVITAAAFKIGDVRLAIYRDEEPHLFIDGEPVHRVSQAEMSALPTGTRVHQRRGGIYRFDWPGGEALEVAVREHYLDMVGIMPRYRLGQIEGVWGNYTNITSDDFKTRDGNIVEKPFTFDEFYNEFADSWRITQEESLFDYGDGEDTTTFSIEGHPEEEPSVDDLPAHLRAEAESACGGITGHPDRSWCIFNVVCLCDDDAAESFEGLSNHESLTDLHPKAPLTVTGDLCLGEPETFELQAAGELSCPPEADPCIHVVREQLGVELGQDLAVDAVDIGVYSSEEALVEEVIPSGTRVDSYLIHVNQVPEGTGRLEGTALCAEEILGIIATDDGLVASDGVVADPLASFDGGSRSADFSTDEFEILPSGSGVRVSVNAEEGIREFRVITRAAGE